MPKIRMTWVSSGGREGETREVQVPDSLMTRKDWMNDARQNELMKKVTATAAALVIGARDA